MMVPNDVDPVLRSFLEASDDRGRAEETAKLLMRVAGPVIEDVLTRSLRFLELRQHAVHEDLRAEIAYRIIRRLEALRRDPDANAITNLHDYVAVASYNVFHDFLRRQFPERARLANQLRYVLTTDPEFALWKIQGRLVCGLAEWEGTPDLETEPETGTTVSTSDIARTRRALAALFTAAGGPLPFVQVVGVLTVPLLERDRSPAQEDLFADAAHHLVVENRQYLQKLWTEIQLLPRRQRVALLLNLRDSRGDAAVRLLPLLGIAPPGRIRETLEIDPEPFERLWESAPIPDDEIAAMFGVTRQQVINLRASARKRLARRMARGK